MFDNLAAVSEGFTDAKKTHARLAEAVHESHSFKRSGQICRFDERLHTAGAVRNYSLMDIETILT